MAQEVPKISVSPEEFTIENGSETTLQLTNICFKPLMYRLLSTAPEKFHVANRHGVLLSGSTISVRIGIVAGGMDEKLKEEFRLEYCFVRPGDNVEGVKDISSVVKKVPKEERKKKLIKCTIRAAPEPAAKSEPARATSTSKPEEVAISASQAAREQSPRNPSAAKAGNNNSPAVAKGNNMPMIAGIAALVVLILAYFMVM